MPLARALKTFAGRYGMIRAGTVFNCEQGYFDSLKRKGMASLAQADPAPARAPDPGPEKDRNIPEAPDRAGKDQGPSTPDTAPRRAGGRGTTSRSLRQALASRRRTSPLSAPGEQSSSSQDDQPAT